MQRDQFFEILQNIVEQTIKKKYNVEIAEQTILTKKRTSATTYSATTYSATTRCLKKKVQHGILGNCGIRIQEGM